MQTLSFLKKEAKYSAAALPGLCFVRAYTPPPKNALPYRCVCILTGGLQIIGATLKVAMFSAVVQNLWCKTNFKSAHFFPLRPSNFHDAAKKVLWDFQTTSYPWLPNLQKITKKNT